MNTAVLIMVLLDNQGYWFGGQDYTVRVRWAADVRMPEAEFDWQLVFGTVTVDLGRMSLRSATSRLRIHVPDVRVPTTLRLIYQIHRPVAVSDDSDSRVRLAEGETTIHVFPDRICASLPGLVGNKTVAVWDVPDELPCLFASVGIGCQRIDRMDELAFQRPDVILVAADRLDGNVNAQQQLLGHAHGGTSVLVLDQPRAKSLFGYRQLMRRGVERGVLCDALFRWHGSSSLARHHAVYKELLVGEMLPALRLPPGSPAREIASWASYAAGRGSRRPVPVDAILACQPVGRGRVVLSRLPLGPWRTDPRAQMFLVDAMDYLISPVESSTPLTSAAAHKTTFTGQSARGSDLVEVFSGDQQ